MDASRVIIPPGKEAAREFRCTYINYKGQNEIKRVNERRNHCKGHTHNSAVVSRNAVQTVFSGKTLLYWGQQVGI